MEAVLRGLFKWRRTTVRRYVATMRFACEKARRLTAF